MKEPVYVDSNVFVFPVILSDNGKHKKVSISNQILDEIEKEKLVAYTSWLTWDEVVWVVLKTVGKADSIEIGRKLLNFPNLRFVDVGEAVMARAASISEKYNLDPRDAIHCGSCTSEESKDRYFRRRSFGKMQGSEKNSS